MSCRCSSADSSRSNSVDSSRGSSVDSSRSSSVDSSKNNCTSTSDWYQPQESCCDCENSLYHSSGREHTLGLNDYGDDQDQFIVRRDCSQTCRRYSRCKAFWVSTCRPSSAQGNFPKRYIDRWEQTCPPPRRPSMQQYLKEQEEKHEAERKARLATKSEDKKDKKSKKKKY